MRNIIIGAALALATTAAHAADVAPKAVYYAPPVAAYNFTGIYAGLNIGGAFADATTTDLNGGVPPGPYGFKPKGVFGGGQAGIGYQWASNVYAGLEADFGYMNATSGKGFVASSNPAFHQDLTLSGGAYVDIAARLGYVFGNNLLVYGKGGGAYVDVSAMQATTKPGYTPTGAGAYSGAVYGGGAEYLLGPNWSVKAEYLHFALGTKGGKQTSLTDPPIGFPYFNETKLGIDTYKVGLNYRFIY